MLEKRCSWCEKDDLYRDYHDNEWGFPIYDDNKLFEYLLLETFQAGLNWHSILKKRENFRAAFEQFDYKKIAEFTDDKILELNQNAGIIRNKLKITSAVNNAQRFIEIQKEFGSFSNYIWAFVDNKPIDNKPKTLADVPATTPLSDKISKDLKKRGFKFIGSTILYAHMQATGMINDHITSCFTRK
jgi:DNA-3-methyladenine glycosylase I